MKYKYMKSNATFDSGIYILRQALLARFVGIWMVLAICIAVDVEGVAYGDACTGSGSGDCTEKTNIVCDTTCKCATDSFRKGGTECATKVAALDGACDATDSALDQCAVADSECRIDGAGGKCLCKATHYVNGAVCKIRIAYGDACTGSGSGDCTEKTNIICDTTCKCSPGTFRKTTATECAAQIGFEQGCEATQTASDQCSVPETECKDDAGTKKCMCKATYYSDGRACQTRIKPNIACTAAGQCVTHATCDTTDTNTCVCDAGYTPSPTISPIMCSGVVKFAALPYMYVVSFLVSMMLLLR